MRDSADLSVRPCEPVVRHSTCFRRVVGDVGIANLHARGNAQVTEPLRDLRVFDHAAAGKAGHLAIELRGRGSTTICVRRCSTRTPRQIRRPRAL